MLRAIDKLEPFQKAISKAHLASAGVSIDSLDHKPLIAIANSWNEICPGHEPLKQLAEEVKKGILEAGGEPIEFNTVAMCDGIAQGHSGMRYCLPHREIITDSIEAMVVGEGVFDGVVYMGSCDKIVPGMLNAAARIDLPSVIVTAGPCYAQIKPNESKELRQQFLRGEITERQLIEGTLKYYTGPGICPFLGTANTMGALCESLGMMLPGGSLIPSSTSMRRFSARESGRAVMKELESVMNKDVLTVTGETLGQILERTPQGDREVIKSMDEPVSRADGIQVLYGNLAPQGALVKTSAVPTEVRRFKGTARVFEGEDECYAAFRAKEIKEGDAVIVRYEGPKGGPGMKELHRITEIIKGIPNTAVITDGRFSGASGGLSIGYLCPEAADGGPIALVRDGDRITVDLYKDYLHLEVSDEELEARRREWKAVTRPREKGLLGRYARLVNTARSGAALNRE